MRKDRIGNIEIKKAFLVNWLLPIAVLIVLGCNSAGNEQTEAAVDMSPSMVFEDNSVHMLFSQEDLAKQKLQDYLDLIVLRNAHPAFESDIKSQLQKLSNDGSLLLSNDRDAVYENIRLKNIVTTSEDIEQKVAFYVDIISEGNRTTDSITAILTKKRIDIDGEELISTKVRFEKN